jgi:hypothetical protein
MWLCGKCRFGKKNPLWLQNEKMVRFSPFLLNYFTLVNLGNIHNAQRTSSYCSTTSGWTSASRRSSPSVAEQFRVARGCLGAGKDLLREEKISSGRNKSTLRLWSTSLRREAAWGQGKISSWRNKSTLGSWSTSLRLEVAWGPGKSMSGRLRRQE